MVILDVFYVALATIVVMLILQVITFLVTRMMYPPQPQVVYRTVQVPVAQPQAAPAPAPLQNAMPPPQQPAFTQPAQDIQLPEYEPRRPTSDGLRLDAVLPDGIQETRPPGL